MKRVLQSFGEGLRATPHRARAGLRASWTVLSGGSDGRAGRALAALNSALLFFGLMSAVALFASRHTDSWDRSGAGLQVDRGWLQYWDARSEPYFTGSDEDYVAWLEHQRGRMLKHFGWPVGKLEFSGGVAMREYSLVWLTPQLWAFPALTTAWYFRRHPKMLRLLWHASAGPFRGWTAALLRTANAASAAAALTLGVVVLLSFFLHFVREDCRGSTATAVSAQDGWLVITEEITQPGRSYGYTSKVYRFAVGRLPSLEDWSHFVPVQVDGSLALGHRKSGFSLFWVIGVLLIPPAGLCLWYLCARWDLQHLRASES